MAGELHLAICLLQLALLAKLSKQAVRSVRFRGPGLSREILDVVSALFILAAVIQSAWTFFAPTWVAGLTVGSLYATVLGTVFALLEPKQAIIAFVGSIVAAGISVYALILYGDSVVAQPEVMGLTYETGDRPAVDTKCLPSGTPGLLPAAACHQERTWRLNGPRTQRSTSFSLLPGHGILRSNFNVRLDDTCPGSSVQWSINAEKFHRRGKLNGVGAHQWLTLPTKAEGSLHMTLSRTDNERCSVSVTLSSPSTEIRGPA